MKTNVDRSRILLVRSHVACVSKHSENKCGEEQRTENKTWRQCRTPITIGFWTRRDWRISGIDGESARSRFLNYFPLSCTVMMTSFELCSSFSKSMIEFFFMSSFTCAKEKKRSRKGLEQDWMERVIEVE